MSHLQNLPEIRADVRLSSAQFDMRQDALESWDPGLRAAAEDKADTISMYGPIGATWDGEGVTAKRISAALRSIGAGKDVTVNINSPGGDFFEGVAIYNLLRMHDGKVTVNVLGIAASAASVIAMSGDDILIGEGASLMIHNAWIVAMGNKNDLRDAADWLEPFDTAMVELYSARTGLTSGKITAMMDAETFIGAEDAIKQGFATGKLAKAATKKDTNASAGNKRALALVEASMAKAGMSRSARREALQALFDGTPRAADEPIVTPGAGNDTEVAASLQNLLTTLKG